MTALSPIESVFALDPGCVYPSMTTGSVRLGRADVGLIVQTVGVPVQPVPVMLNAMVSVTPTLALESRIAWRSDPAPESEVLVTVRVAAQRDSTAASRKNAG